MNYKKSLLLVLVFILGLAFFVFQDKEGIHYLNLGSDLGGSGEISKTSLSYSFDYNIKEKENTSIQKLFNFIYFEGDTLCFSAKFGEEVKKQDVKIFFINPKNGDVFPAERVDIDRKKISGFSLVGTILEQFYSVNSKKGLSLVDFADIKIPFIVRIEIDNGEKIYTKEKTSSFKLNIN